jgi:hypothetical protein
VKPRKVDPEHSQVCASQVATITRQKDSDAERIIQRNRNTDRAKETKDEEQKTEVHILNSMHYNKINNNYKCTQLY